MIERVVSWRSDSICGTHIQIMDPVGHHGIIGCCHSAGGWGVHVVNGIVTGFKVIVGGGQVVVFGELGEVGEELFAGKRREIKRQGTVVGRG